MYPRAFEAHGRKLTADGDSQAWPKIESTLVSGPVEDGRGAPSGFRHNHGPAYVGTSNVQKYQFMREEASVPAWGQAVVYFCALAGVD